MLLSIRYQRIIDINSACELFDEDFLPAKHAQSLGSTFIVTPESTSLEGLTPGRNTSMEASRSNLSNGNGKKVPLSPAMMDMFSDPAGVGFDIASLSFDVGRVAGLFSAEGGEMDQTIVVNEWRDDPKAWE